MGFTSNDKQGGLKNERDYLLFSGTGNSYRIARAISNGLDKAALIDIAKMQSPEHSIPSNIVGIIFPLYYFGLPIVVE